MSSTEYLFLGGFIAVCIKFAMVDRRISQTIETDVKLAYQFLDYLRNEERANKLIMQRLADSVDAMLEARKEGGDER